MAQKKGEKYGISLLFASDEHFQAESCTIGFIGPLVDFDEVLPPTLEVAAEQLNQCYADKDYELYAFPVHRCPREKIHVAEEWELLTADDYYNLADFDCSVQEDDIIDLAAMIRDYAAEEDEEIAEQKRVEEEEISSVKRW